MRPARAAPGRAPSPAPAPAPASAIVLSRGRGSSLEVFLIERSARLRFFGGFWAFPGGRVDDDDRRARDASDRDSFARCALRELFEETGVLPAALARSLDSDRRAALRERLVARGRGAVPEWERALAAAPRAVGEPIELCRLVTPPFGPLRYDTVFYRIELPPGEVAAVVRGELVGGAWMRPALALERWRAGELAIVPPVVEMLAMLAEGDLALFARRARTAADAIAAGRLRASRHAPGVACMPLATPTLPPATTTNCVVFGTERLWVVDPATWDAGERERLLGWLDERVAEGARVEGVLATHHHHDHVGSVGAVSRRYGVPVRAHPETLARIPADYAAASPLADGERIELGAAPDERAGWGLVALHTPGHARGHLAFQEDRYGAVAAGDLVSTVSTIVIDPPEGHLATYLASLRRVRALAPAMVHPAHGPIARDGVALCDRYLRHRAEREASLVRALADGGGTTGDLVPRLYADVDRRLWPLAERSLAAGLEKLAEEGRARRDGRAWTLSEAAHMLGTADERTDG